MGPKETFVSGIIVNDIPHKSLPFHLSNEDIWEVNESAIPQKKGI